MFLINLEKENLEFRAHGLTLILKPGVNFVDNNQFTSKELKDHFGNFISFITEDEAEENKNYVKREIPEPIVPVEEVVEEKAEEVAPVVEEIVEEAPIEDIVIEEDLIEAPIEDLIEEAPIEEKVEAPKAKTTKAKSAKKNNKK